MTTGDKQGNGNVAFVPTKSRPMNMGTQDLYSFPNGYGASVICGPYSYGSKAGLYELAVIGPNGDLDYTTPITSDVLGWLDPEQVQAVLRDISELPAVTS